MGEVSSLGEICQLATTIRNTNNNGGAGDPANGVGTQTNGSLQNCGKDKQDMLLEKLGTVVDQLQQPASKPGANANGVQMDE
eukprot:7829103-Karenia_brevis.AAC.1